MSGRLARAVVLTAPLLLLYPGLVTARPPGTSEDPRADARALAERIDKLIESRAAAAGVRLAPPADDPEFFRRLCLDLNGRIPSLLEIRDFLDDDAPGKRADWIERVLAKETADGKSPYARHFAAVLRSWMLSGSTNNIQAQIQQPQFEAWLEQRLRADKGYHRIVRDLLTNQAGPVGGGFAPGAMGGPGSPAAFYFDNENKAENLAGTTSRVFLGVKLECAQCHKHPFAKWTKNQFWEYAAFFGRFTPPQPGKRPLPVALKPGEIRIGTTDKIARARFFDGKQPDLKAGVDARVALVDWMTAADNPYFARAAADHVWTYFFGVSLLERITEPHDDGLPTHPDLLNLLAKEFRDHQYDVKFLVRAIVSTRAYQRSSRSPSGGKQDVFYFARMPVRGLSPEQLFDSVAEATDYREAPGMAGPQFQPFNAPQTPRRQFLAKFAGQDRRSEAHTSILQALFMMNGKFLAERTKLENNTSLQTLMTSPASATRRLETLYLLVLSRLPRPDEAERLVRYLEGGGPAHNQGRALADVYWVLLNSGEFCLNH
jgi:hypothetical protein